MNSINVSPMSKTLKFSKINENPEQPTNTVVSFKANPDAFVKSAKTLANNNKVKVSLFATLSTIFALGSYRVNSDGKEGRKLITEAYQINPELTAQLQKRSKQLRVVLNILIVRT